MSNLIHKDYPRHLMLGDHVTSEFFNSGIIVHYNPITEPRTYIVCIDPEKMFPNSTDFKCVMCTENELTLVRYRDRFCNKNVKSLPYMETHLMSEDEKEYVRRIFKNGETHADI